MPNPDWSFTIADQPKFAPAHWRLLPPYGRNDGSKDIYDGGDSWGIWVGSGFQIKELPCYQNYNFYYCHDPLSFCGNCKGTNTICLYLHNVIHQTGIDIDAEIYCHDCNVYTQYNGYR